MSIFRKFRELKSVIQIRHLPAGIAVLLTLGTVTCGEPPHEAPKEPDQLLHTDAFIDKKQLPKLRGQISGYLRKQVGRTVQAPPPPSGNADVWCIKRYDAAQADKKKLIRLIAEDLALSEILGTGDADKRVQSVSIAIEASRCALIRLEDKNLSPAIIDVYVLPLFSDLSMDSSAIANQYDVLQSAGHVYQSSGRLQQALAAYRTLSERAPNRNMSDFAQFRMAQVYQVQENYSEALRALAGISDFDGMSGAKSLAPGLREKLRSQQKERNCCNVD